MKTAKNRRGVSDAENQRVNLRLSTAAHQRLAVHALMAGTTPGRLVERLIEEHLKSWRVQAVAVQANRSVPVTADDRLEIGAEMSQANATAA
jgi:hypothetical protein